MTNDLTKEIQHLSIGYDNLTVEDFGRRTKVSGRTAHYIREAVEDDHKFRVERDINQHAFIVEWNA